MRRPGIAIALAVIQPWLVGCGRLSFDLGESIADQCTNAIADPDEQGIDCGGPCATHCPGTGCNEDRDCVTGFCDRGFCELATAPPHWVPGPSLTSPRSTLKCATAKQKLICAGGSDLAGTETAVVDGWQTGMAGFASEPTMLQPRGGINLAALADGSILAHGGFKGGSGTATLEAFDGISWRARATSANLHAFASLAQATNGLVYSIDTGASERYDPVADQWTGKVPQAPVPADRNDLVPLGDDLMVVGGETDPGNRPTAAVYVLDTATESWRQVANLLVARKGAASVIAPDGRIYAFGGSDAGGRLAVVDIYRGELDRWSPGPSLSTPRDFFGGAVGPDGRIFAVGGVTNSGVVTTSEVYGPVVAVAPTSAAAGATVVVNGSNFAAGARLAITANGKVLAVGQTDANGAASVDVVVPGGVTGSLRIVATDVRSQYPVATTLTVTP